MIFTHPTPKACNSSYMQYYFKRCFILHSPEVIFSFLIKKSGQKAIEIEIAFFSTRPTCNIISNGVLFCIPRKLYFHFWSKGQRKKQ